MMMLEIRMENALLAGKNITKSEKHLVSMLYLFCCAIINVICFLSLYLRLHAAVVESCLGLAPGAAPNFSEY